MAIRPPNPHPSAPHEVETLPSTPLALTILSALSLRSALALLLALALAASCATPESPGHAGWTPAQAPLGPENNPAFTLMSERPPREGPFVVAHFGDSHSSIPAMPATLRDLLAEGDPTSPGFVAPEHHTPEAHVAAIGSWSRHNWIYSHERGPFGPLGVSWGARSAGARMLLKLKAAQTPKAGVKVTALFALEAGHSPFELRSGDRLLAEVDSPETLDKPLDIGAVEVQLPAGATEVELLTTGDQGLRFFGFLVRFPGAAVEYDAFGVIGARIRSPLNRADAALDGYFALRKPDMVVVWYGSNCAYNKNLDLAEYGAQYLALLTQMRARAPGAVCVAIAPPDLGRAEGACRGTSPPQDTSPDKHRASPGQQRAQVDSQGRAIKRRSNVSRARPRGGALKRAPRRARGLSEGGARDIPTAQADARALQARPDPGDEGDMVCEGQGPIPGIVRVQREAALQAGCAYFDTFTWMGGPGSMQRWARNNPRLGAGDLVHLTIAGYEQVARGLYEALPGLRDAPPSPPPGPFAAHLGDPDPRCPGASTFDASLRLCVEDDEAIGPFPEAMARQCQLLGGAGCQSHRWELSVARQARGAGDCPPGAQLDPRLGYCVDRRFAYGPFPEAHVRHCHRIGGGEACQTLRWPRAITPPRPGALTRSSPQEHSLASRQGPGLQLSSGVCESEPRALQMSWGSCADHLDCFEAKASEGGPIRRFLQTPSTGPVAMEAHLVTEEDAIEGYPKSSRDRVKDHYALSESISGYAMRRTQSWAPAGEGGCQFGQGSSPGKVPAAAETWYINMFWSKRPPRGTRMIVTNPANGRSVVAAAGYETGPGSNEVMAGVSEEIHDYLGTRHRGHLQVGFAVDQSLPFGPIECR